MKVITSKDNPIYKDAVRLTRRKYREETERYLVEGMKPVMEALDGGVEIERIFVREGSQIGISGVDRDRLTGLSGALFGALSDTENSQGVIAVATRPAIDRDSFLDRIGKGNILVLDRLQDPGNVGTVIRTAEAAGFTGVAAIKGTADVYSPKVVRAASGTLFRMPVITGISEEEAMDMIRDGDRKLAVTSVEDGEDCFHASISGPVALVIGNEGSGVSEEFISRADIRLMIPMAGEIESLNAAVAAGILMYRLRYRD